MRIAIQAVISDVEGRDTRTQDIGVLEYDADVAPASGLGLFIGEAHQLLRQLQTVVLREQTARFMERVCRCRQCGSRLGIKDSKTIVYRTVYGKAHLDSPRLYSTCGRCGARATPARSFSPLAEALPERTHPQWLWLQSRYAAVMSYRQAQTFLRDAFPAGRSLPVSSMKVNVRHTGERMEAEVQLVARTFVRRPRRSQRPAIEQQLAQGPQIELAVDAGYIRALPEKEGVRNLAVVASKLVRPVARHGYTHAYVGSSNPHQGARQQAFLTMLRVPQDAPVTVLSDGGDDVAFACKLPRPTERVLVVRVNQGDSFSSRSSRHTQRHPGLARPCQPRHDKPLRRDHDANQGGRPCGMFASGGFGGIPGAHQMAAGPGLDEVAAIAVTVMCPVACDSSSPAPGLPRPAT